VFSDRDSDLASCKKIKNRQFKFTSDPENIRVEDPESHRDIVESENQQNEESLIQMQMFDEFIVIGADTETIKHSALGKDDLHSEVTLDPQILYRNYQEESSKPIDGLGSFLFPFGYKASIMDESDIKDIVHE